MHYARDKHYKLYSDGRFFDVANDVLENSPLEEREELQAVRAKLQAVLNRYPTQGAMIDYERIKQLQAAPPPAEAPQSPAKKKKKQNKKK